jgi:peptidyl-prolyl cis-trans isomerase B (cyclophilin B)
MTSALTAIVMMFSVLVPQKMWYAPTQSINITNKSNQDVTLVLTRFTGEVIPPKSSADIKAGQSADVKAMFLELSQPNTYILYAIPKTSSPPKTTPTTFLGTPIVIEVIVQPVDQSVQLVHVVPLNYAVIQTDAGSMTAIFYYDVAPHTTDSFLQLSSEGFYDGLIFHRIVPGFVIQGGDPSATGMGGPGYHLDAEFNDKPHLEGVLSMARNGDPNEDPSSGVAPRAQYANSAGSQFFICLDYKATQALDHHYTAYGRVVQGLDVLQKIGQSEIADPQNGTPKVPTAIQTIKVLPVTADNNPYHPAAPITQP